MPSGIGPGGISIYRRFFLSLIFSLVILISVFSLPVSALHTLSGTSYANLMRYRSDNGCPILTIHYSEPWSYYCDDGSNYGIYDVNCIVLILPGHYYSYLGGRYYTISSSVSNQTMHTADYGLVSLFNNNSITEDEDSGVALDSMFTYLTFGFDSSPGTISAFEIGIAYGYYSNNGGSFVVYPESASITTVNTLSLPYSYTYEEGTFIHPRGYYQSANNRCYINLCDSYKIAHDISSIDFEGEVDFDNDVGSGNGCNCNCTMVCDCDCGYYTDELYDQLTEYFETNMVTVDMFEEYINNSYTSINNDYTIIQSMVSDTSFSADIESYVGDQDALFSDLNGYGSQLDNFESQLTISPEVSQAAGFLSGAFGSLPPSLIGALVFVLVMLVVVKILGR